MAAQQSMVFAETIRAMKLAMRRRDNGTSALSVVCRRLYSHVGLPIRFRLGRVNSTSHQSRQQTEEERLTRPRGQTGYYWRSIIQKGRDMVWPRSTTRSIWEIMSLTTGTED